MNSQVSGNSQLWAAIVELPYLFQICTGFSLNKTIITILFIVLFIYYLIQSPVVIDYTLMTDNS